MMNAIRTVLTGTATSLVLLAMATSVAEAKERLTYVEGTTQCRTWCDAHNKTDKSRNACYKRCDAYWLRNASDGDKYLVDGLY